MASLLELVRRPPPEPWRDGDNIPWHEPGFSGRMLAEHLSQAHDAASRRTEKIDEHVAWIQERVLDGRPAKVLDLGCGPGLYTARLGELGHECTGIDYSPAAIAYARQHSDAPFIESDLRRAEFGEGFRLVMLISGELNSFRREDAMRILRQAQDALVAGGALLLEVHPFDVIKKIGGAPHTWYAAERALFSDQPHVCLYERSWDEATSTATTRYFVIDAASGEVTTYAGTQQAYTEEEYQALLRDSGFEDAETIPSLTGQPDESQADFFVLLARKREGA